MVQDTRVQAAFRYMVSTIATSTGCHIAQETRAQAYLLQLVIVQHATQPHEHLLQIGPYTRPLLSST